MGKRIMITGAHTSELWKRFARDPEVDRLLLVGRLDGIFRVDVMKDPAYLSGKIQLFTYDTTEPEFFRVVTESILRWRDLTPPDARIDAICHLTLNELSRGDALHELDLAYIGTRNVLELARIYQSKVFVEQKESYKESFGVADALIDAYRKKYGLEIMDL